MTGNPTTNSLASYAFNGMWGGISLDIPADNVVKVPAGTLAGLADGTPIAVRVGATTNVYYYTVASTTAGTPASTDALGNLVPEGNATLTLTPVAYAGIAATNLNAGLVGGTAGIIIGEYRTVVHSQTTSTLTGVADGTHKTNISVLATDAGGGTALYPTTSAADLNETTTTVKKNPINVYKYADVANAKPGTTVTYTVEVTNNSTSATSAAKIADPLSPYVTYIPGAGKTKLNGHDVADGGVFPLAGAGMDINTDGQAAGVILPGAANKAVIVYKVVVN
jgi:uncharacterized repeat protein (TIGR01451 family)